VTGGVNTSPATSTTAPSLYKELQRLVPVPRRPLEGDEARNARQWLVFLVPDERQGRNKVGNSGSHAVSQISFHFRNQTIFGIW